jgi:hypothetical protein
MGSAGRRVYVPKRYLPPPVPIPPAAREHRIPAGTAITASCQLGGRRGVQVHVYNVGFGACALVGITQDGGDYVLRAGKRVELGIADSCDVLSLRIRSTAGTAVQIAATGHYVPLTLRTQKTIVRDPKTHLISHVIETPVLVPAP